MPDSSKTYFKPLKEITQRLQRNGAHLTGQDRICWPNFPPTVLQALRTDITLKGMGNITEVHS